MLLRSLIFTYSELCPHDYVAPYHPLVATFRHWLLLKVADKRVFMINAKTFKLDVVICFQ
jgi:hypothetical protein